MKEDKESDEVDEASEDDKGELMKHLVIKKDKYIVIDAIPLATKLPVIIDYKIYKEGCLQRNRPEKNLEDTWGMITIKGGDVMEFFTRIHGDHLEVD
ncbi:hypothetical protein Tco_0516344 [Tanacetum coccineum]